MPTLLLPDVMGDLRTWTRALGLNVGGRAFFAVPPAAQFPLCRLTRVGGTLDPQLPIGNPIIQWHLLGDLPSQYAAVSSDARTLEAALWQLTGPVGATTWVKDCTPESVIDQPDPDDDAPGVAITARLLITHQ